MNQFARRSLQLAEMAGAASAHTYNTMLHAFVDKELPHHTVYQNNRSATLTRALRSHFPLLCAELGEQIFSALVQVYIKHFPSCSWDINLYGDGFAHFVLAQQKSQLGCDYDWDMFAWVAEIEYQLLCLYYSDSSGTTTIELSLPTAINRDHQLRLIEQLPLHHAWLEFDTTSVLVFKKSSEIKLTAARHLSSEGFRMILQIQAVHVKPMGANKDKRHKQT